MRLQGLIHVVHGRDILDVIERLPLEQTVAAQHLLHLLHADLGQRHRALLLVDLVVRFLELRDIGVDGVVKLRAVVQRTRDDERGTRFIDQDRVDLVHDGVNVPALDHVLESILHVVAQIIEAELVVGAVGDVGVVSLLALLVVQAMDDDADLEPEEIVDLPHPLGVALCQVVVYGHHVHAAPRKRIEIDRQRRDQRLAFAGLHLRDPSLVQDHAADELHVEMPLTERALGCLAASGEGRNQNVVEARSSPHLLPELVRARPQRLVRERLELLLQRVDRCHPWKVRLDPPLVRRTKQLAGNDANHAVSPSRPIAELCRTLPNPMGRNAAAEANFCRDHTCAITHGRGTRKMPHFSNIFHAAAAACGRVGRVCGEIGGGHTLVNRPPSAHVLVKISL